jgi:nucleoside-diphosphate-sugar epimerase
MDTVKVMPAWKRRIRPIGLQPRHYRPLPRLFRRRRLLIIGCGDVGRRIAALCGSDWRVYGIARSPASLAGVRAAGAVALPAEAPARRYQDLADWVIHSAPPPADGRRKQDVGIDRLTRQWSARLLQRRWPAIPAPAPTAPAWASTRRLVYLSTTGVYGDRQGRFTDEATPPRPLTDRARRRVDAEHRLRQAARRPGAMRLTTLRVPGIYAADRLPLARLREGVPALQPADDVQTNHIHADDLARLARAALLRGRGQRTINVVDDSALPMGDYLDLVARWAGLPPPPRVDRPTLLSTVTPMRASFMSESRRLGNRRMKRELRLRLRYPTVADFLAAERPPAPI